MSSRDGRRSGPIVALGRVSRVPRMKIAKARRLSQLRSQFHEYRELANGEGVSTRLDWSDLILCADDSTTSTSYDRHYLLHPAWAARIVQQLAPAQHIDISSTLNFCSMVSAFVPCRFYDFRPVELGLSNLEMGSADLTGLFFADNSLESVSCMHVVEHIGLGRYGDPLDATGDKKAMSELEEQILLEIR